MSKRKKRPITAEDLYNIKIISDCRISPDGHHVIFSVQRVDKKTEKKYSNLWIVLTNGKAARQFTYGDHSDTHPRWSPDGTEIAFISNRGVRSPGFEHLFQVLVNLSAYLQGVGEASRPHGHHHKLL